MNKILLSEMSGTVTNIFVPNVYDKYGFIDEGIVDIIAIEIKTKEGLIKLIKPMDSKYSSLFVDDNVNIRKYSLEYDYDTYLTELRKVINNYYSEHKEDYRNLIYRKYHCTFEEFKQKPRKIIDYEVVFDEKIKGDNINDNLQKVIIDGSEVLIPIMTKKEELENESMGVMMNEG